LNVITYLGNGQLQNDFDGYYNSTEEVIIYCGSNDAASGQSAANTASRVVTLGQDIQGIIGYNSKIGFVLSVPRNDGTPLTATAAVNAGIVQGVATLGGSGSNFYVGSIPQTGFSYCDTVHPNQAGFQFLGAWIANWWMCVHNVQAGCAAIGQGGVNTWQIDLTLPWTGSNWRNLSVPWK